MRGPVPPAGMCERATADRVRDRLNQSLAAIGFVGRGGDGARSTWRLGVQGLKAREGQLSLKGYKGGLFLLTTMRLAYRF